ncbi:YeiH family protein [Phenylobacterium sp.]|uniref:YeiH family protein n=1 Tax=Phenylobacterium sp. TaxID=1871053 RepID=UPI00391983FF
MSSDPLSRRRRRGLVHGPGLALCLAIGLLAFALHRLPALALLSPLILAVLLGMAVRNVAGPLASCEEGIALTLRGALRLGIVLLGFQVSLGQVLALGLPGLAVIIFAVTGVYPFTVRAGRWLGVDAGLARLLGAGCAVCGASAIVAANTVVEAPEEDVAYAVAAITLFGLLGLGLLPLASTLLHLSPHQQGLWAGGALHEVAQATAAAFQGGPEAGRTGVVTKLGRVALLAPLVLILAARSPATASGPRPGVPGFLLGFVGAVALNSLVSLDPGLKSFLSTVTTLLMTVALAAMGLGASFAALVRRGPRPLLLAGLATLFISAGTLVLVVGLA